MPSRFVDITEDRVALSAALSRMKMIAPDEIPTLHRLTGGVSSNIVRIDIRRGSFCLKQALPTLKVEKEWHAPVERVFVEIAWLRAAAAIVPANIPAIVAVDEQTGSFLMEFLPPEKYVGWKSLLLDGHVPKGVASQLGAAMSEIHNSTAGNPGIVATFDKPFNDQNFMAIRLDSYLLETGRQHPARAAYFQALVDSFLANKRTLVHGDISPKNILLSDEGPMILDAECACYGDPAFDVAFLLNHLLLKAAHQPRPTVQEAGAAKAFSDEFAGFVETYFAGVIWEPAADLELRVAKLLPALLLARVDGKSPVEYLGQTQREKVRALAIRLLDSQPRTLQDIQSTWYSEIVK